MRSGPPPLCFESATRGSSVDAVGIGRPHLAAREIFSLPIATMGEFKFTFTKRFAYLR